MYFLMIFSRALRAAIKPTMFWMTLVMVAYYATGHYV